MDTNQMQDLWEAVAKLRNERWSACSIIEEGAGLDVDDVEEGDMTSMEAWWFHHGAAEALAAVMTALEARGASPSVTTARRWVRTDG